MYALLRGRIHSLDSLSHSKTPLEKLEEEEARASKGTEFASEENDRYSDASIIFF